MFSKPKTDVATSAEKTAKPAQPISMTPANPLPAERSSTPAPANQPKAKPSLLSEDLVIEGNVMTEGDIQIEGSIDGDVRASMLTIGETAVIRGELAAEDVVVNGHVIGQLRGRKVRLTASAHVEGDIIHKTIAIEAGAQFEGSVQREDDPLADSRAKSPAKIKDGRPASGIPEAKTTAAE